MKLITGIQNGKPVDIGQFFENCKFFEGKKVDIDIKDHDEKRTVDQNSALWRWDNLLAEESGYTATEMHYGMCCAIFGVTTIEKPDGSKRDVPKRTTSNLTKAEWQDYIRDYRIIARDIYNYEMPNFGWND